MPRFFRRAAELGEVFGEAGADLAGHEASDAGAGASWKATAGEVLPFHQASPWIRPRATLPTMTKRPLMIWNGCSVGGGAGGVAVASNSGTWFSLSDLDLFATVASGFGVRIVVWCRGDGVR